MSCSHDVLSGVCIMYYTIVGVVFVSVTCVCITILDVVFVLSGVDSPSKSIIVIFV